MNFIAWVLILKQQHSEDRDVGYSQTYQNLASSWQCTICLFLKQILGPNTLRVWIAHLEVLCYVMWCDVVLFYELQELLTSWTETSKMSLRIRIQHVHYTQLLPCGHPVITDTLIIQTAAKSQAKCLTEINSRYYRLSIMRTLTQGAYNVCYKGSWVYLLLACYAIKSWDVVRVCSTNCWFIQSLK